MGLSAERRILQLLVGAACIVPLSTGALSVVRGIGFIRGAPSLPDLDSHFRYLSGIFLMVGIAFASCIPAIERQGPRFRLLGAMVVAGGFARLLSWIMVGPPGPGHRFGLVMELGVVPLLMLWQLRLERKFPQK